MYKSNTLTATTWNMNEYYCHVYFYFFFFAVFYSHALEISHWCIFYTPGYQWNIVAIDNDVKYQTTVHT